MAGLAVRTRTGHAGSVWPCLALSGFPRLSEIQIISRFMSFKVLLKSSKLGIINKTEKCRNALRSVMSLVTLFSLFLLFSLFSSFGHFPEAWNFDPNQV